MQWTSSGSWTLAQTESRQPTTVLLLVLSVPRRQANAEQLTLMDEPSTKGKIKCWTKQGQSAGWGCAMASKKMGSPNSDLSLSVLRPGTESQGHKIPSEWKDWSRARVKNKIKRKKSFQFGVCGQQVSECVVCDPPAPVPLKAGNKTGPDETDLDLLPWFCAGVRWLTRRLCV